MGQAIGDLLPSAIGVAISPVPIIAIILMLGTPKAGSNGVAFAVGWILALVVVSVIVLLVASDADDADSGTSTAVAVVLLLLGLLFVVMAWKQWQGRPQPGVEPAVPKWMAAVDRFTAGRSFGFGALLAGVNPKNLALTLAAAATIAKAGLDGGETAIAVAVFVIIGSLTVAGPVIYYLLAGDRAAGPLAGIKQFMSDHNAVIMTILFIVLGMKLVGDGIAGLTD